MAKWTDYTTDTNPTDTDEVMTLDADKSPKANKRVTLSTLADYFLDKLASKVFAKLDTQNKTVIGALNELNSNTSKLYISMTENIADFDSKYTTINKRLRILYGIIENDAYISFDVNWIRIQLKSDTSNLFVRIVYGNSQIENWVQIK